VQGEGGVCGSRVVGGSGFQKQNHLLVLRGKSFKAVLNDFSKEAIMADDCLFCKILKKEIPSKAVFEDDRVYAFHDIKPLAPIHVLFIPKKHIPTVADVQTGDDTAAVLVDRANRVAREMGLAEKGYRLMFNCGPDGGQVVYHLHLHLLGGKMFK
jgi:histidine triad (HIT) family protein